MGQPAIGRRSVAIAVLAAAVVAAGPGASGGTGRSPSGLPDSLDIAYSFAGGIHVMRPHGSGAVRVIGTSAIPAGEPAWSPDGSRLALVRSMGEELSDAFRSRIEILDGTGERPLTAWSEDTVGGPAWSPDGRQIAFSRWLGEDQNYATEIVVVSVDGGAERVPWRQRRDARRTQVRQPVWSPDGTRIAFTQTRLDRSFDFRDSLYVVDAAGGTPRRLAREASDMSWSPDGTRIAFSSGRDRNGKSCGSDECFYNDELYVMNAHGSAPVRLTRNRGDESSPSWSPDGRYIAFASDRNVHDPRGFDTEIYAVRADGSCLTWLTNGARGAPIPPGAQARLRSSGRHAVPRRGARAWR
jgi:Tol biopolymer transport system component